jgi:signal transduction histidine kinase
MNARDAMEGQSGVIKIRTWNQRVTRSDGRRQDMVALEVIDRGSGMSQEVKSGSLSRSSPPSRPAAAAD